ncbi:hypothetical protein SARC_12104 [Sphaeroforma arctica JP610]|uniref:tRNA-binding domain-containing protein n=1 Tax=Sphaeroforma arctica JP610 TaxID=667725 RepID=A0A0L0FH30_9EUKA|nr:hypothetical protein SARC_12104 [Sphaeroforma arctica JP610]KNC75368.1 hypothetical protein SARC_12104 [Sphaeroforma arctica JP610]|eukprot:XP_014149270.1 hypothetical protein SARC_12104 [Sphaeroforma arctica JP610]
MANVQENRVAEYEKLEKEIARGVALRKEVEDLSGTLKNLNETAGRNAFELDGKNIAGEDLSKASSEPSSTGSSAPSAGGATSTEAEKPAATQHSGQKKEKKAKAPKADKAPAAGDKPLDISRLKMVVGKIVEVEKHPEADGLYLEQIDVGEEKPRTIISGLVKCYTLEDMKGRDVVVLLNLKPANWLFLPVSHRVDRMRGILSCGMVMCGVDATNADAPITETVTPPTGSKPGDLITFEGFTGEADEQLNPKKKVFEQIQPGFKINNKGEATWNDVVFSTAGGVCTVPRCAPGSTIR